MRLLTPIAKLWIDFFADDPGKLPAWVQRIVTNNPKLKASLDDRIRFEARLRDEQEDWCQSWTENQAEQSIAQGSASDPKRISAWEEITQHDSTDQIVRPAKRQTVLWRTTGILAASLIGLVMVSMWWNSPSNGPEVAKLPEANVNPLTDSDTGASSDREGTFASEPSQDSTGRELLLSNEDLLPVLATAAATQEVATKITASSWMLAARIGELPNRLGVQQLLLSSEDGMRSAIRRLTTTQFGELTGSDTNSANDTSQGDEGSAPPSAP